MTFIHITIHNQLSILQRTLEQQPDLHNADIQQSSAGAHLRS
jgi:hypothetical protein